MAAGEWVSVSAQNELIQRELDIERRELLTNPAAETAELVADVRRRRHGAGASPRAAADVMREPAEALAVHARAELGIDPAHMASPWQAAAASMLCFLLGAILPVLPVARLGDGHRADGGLGRHRRRRRRRRRVRSSAGSPTVDRPIDRPPGADRARRLRHDLPHRAGRRHQRVSRSRRSTALAATASGSLAEHGEVAHLATGPGRRLAVEVQTGVGLGEDGVPTGFTSGPPVAEQVDHGDRTRRQLRARPGPDRRPPAPAARTGWCVRRRGSSGRCCAASAPAR